MRIRAAALISVGALVVHDLRYLIAYRGRAGEELSVTGHGYLGVVTPLAMGLLALAVAAFTWRVLMARGHEPRLPSTKRLWGFHSAVLVAIYVSQEWIEGVAAKGHPGGIAAVVSHGGWIAFPLALAVALIIALLLRGDRAAIALAAGHRRTWLRPRAVLALVAPSVWRPLTGDALARRLAPRGPPFPSV